QRPAVSNDTSREPPLAGGVTRLPGLGRHLGCDAGPRGLSRRFLGEAGLFLAAAPLPFLGNRSRSVIAHGTLPRVREPRRSGKRTDGAGVSRQRQPPRSQGSSLAMIFVRPRKKRAGRQGPRHRATLSLR